MMRLDATAAAEIRDRIEAESRAQTTAGRERFKALFAEWLRNRAQTMQGFGGEDIPRPHSERETELARLITTTPAALPWMILLKLEVLEHYAGSEQSAWTDNREVVMLAGIRADLLRFPPEDRP